MSMPQPIYVALVGSTADVVRRARKHFRLSAPGIGPPCLAKLETRPSHDVPRLTQIPAAQIVLWVALDTKSFAAAQTRHRDDLRNSRYDRGFYNVHFPEPCILVDFDRNPKEAKKQLAELALRVIEAWYATS